MPTMPKQSRTLEIRSTTVLCVRRGDKVAIAGDGQVTMGNAIMKGNARKVRRLYKNQVIAGFAGGTADAFTLFELFEGKLEKHTGQLTRAAVELAKEWRTSKMLRNLEALLVVADTGDVTWTHSKEKAVDAARESLAAGGSGLDAVEDGIRLIESLSSDGSVGLGGRPNAAGYPQLDACIMNGPDHGAGSVAGVEGIVHPVLADTARARERFPDVEPMSENTLPSLGTASTCFRTPCIGSWIPARDDNTFDRSHR